MKLSCNQFQLAKAINMVSKAVTNRTTIPILKGILLRAEEGTLTLSASDLDLSIETKIDAIVSEPGSLVLASRLFSDIIRKLPNEEIEIEEEENHMTVIRCLSSEFRIVSQPEDDFPNIMEVEEKNHLVLNKEMLKDMIRKTAFSASIEEAKGVITGVLLELKNDTFTMVALDGFRMAVAKTSTEQSEEKKIIIHARILNEINKILSESDGDNDVDLILDEKKAVFLQENTKVVLRLLEGEFLRYRDIIPKESKVKAVVNKGELQDCIERASLLAKEGKNNLIKMSLFRDKIIITSRSEEGNVKEEIFVQKDGEDMEIGFNAKYIIDVLKAISDEEVSMEFNTSVSPCLIRPIEGDSFEYLILPVRINVG